MADEYFGEKRADEYGVNTIHDSGATDPATGDRLGAVMVEVTGGTSPAPVATKMGTILSGTTGAGAAAIGTTQPCLSVLLINTHATLTLLWGNSTTQPATLEAGAQQVIPASNITEVFVKNGSGAATWVAIPEVVA